jgi:hypothetical protein
MILCFRGTINDTSAIPPPSFSLFLLEFSTFALSEIGTRAGQIDLRTVRNCHRAAKNDLFDTARDTPRYLVEHFQIPILTKSERRKSCNASFQVVRKDRADLSAPRAGRIFRANP